MGFSRRSPPSSPAVAGNPLCGLLKKKKNFSQSHRTKRGGRYKAERKGGKKIDRNERRTVATTRGKDPPLRVLWLLKWFTLRRWRLLSTELPANRVWFSAIYYARCELHCDRCRNNNSLPDNSSQWPVKDVSFLLPALMSPANRSYPFYSGSRCRVFRQVICLLRRADSSLDNESGSIVASSEYDVDNLWRNSRFAQQQRWIDWCQCDWAM